MSDHSRNSRRYRYDKDGRAKEVQRVKEHQYSIEHGRSHRFTIFRMGDDICAKCGKPRGEHK